MQMNVFPNLLCSGQLAFLVQFPFSKTRHMYGFTQRSGFYFPFTTTAALEAYARILYTVKNKDQ